MVRGARAAVPPRGTRTLLPPDESDTRVRVILDSRRPGHRRGDHRRRRRCRPRRDRRGRHHRRAQTGPHRARGRCQRALEREPRHQGPPQGAEGRGRQARGPGQGPRPEAARRAPAGARSRGGGGCPRRGDRGRHPAHGSSAARRRASADHAAPPHRGRLRGHGLGDRRGARDRGGVVQLRRPELRRRPSGAADAGHLLRRARGIRPRAAHPHLAGAGPCPARARGAAVHRVPGHRVPHR